MIDRAELDPIWDRVNDARREADKANANITAHEALCAERYRAIHATMADIRAILKWGGLALISVLSAVAWAYIKQSLNLQ